MSYIFGGKKERTGKKKGRLWMKGSGREGEGESIAVVNVSMKREGGRNEAGQGIEH